MPRRAEQVRLLAELLSARPHSRAVTARWQVEPGEPAGCWTLSWTEGPDADTMSYWARELIAAEPRLAGLDGHACWLWWRRVDSPAAWAALLLRSAGPDPYRSPPQWRSAEQLHGHVADMIGGLGWLDEPDGPGEAVAVAGLLATSRGEVRRMARMVLAEWRGLPPAATVWEQQRRPTGRCEQCGALFLVKPGPVQRWCGPQCRLRHWRATRAATATLTEPGNEPRCASCAGPLPTPGRPGRPARYCGPACRQFAHHHRRNDPDQAAAAHARRRHNPPTPPAARPAPAPPVPAPQWAAAPVRKPRPVRPPLPVELEGCLAGSRTVHQLHVAVADIDPPIWRRLQVPSAMPLIRLSDVVCVVLDWSGEHLHSFTGVAGEAHAGVNQREFRTTVADLLPAPGHQSTYTYDFGDWWQVHLTVEKILTRPQSRTFYPRATAGRRAGPAEDCGGVPGYEQLLKALRARKGWRYRQAREQHPGWGPEDFDLADINHQLERWYLDQQPDGSTSLLGLTCTPTGEPG